ncbi:MAG: multiheme c-type cytochrome [Caldimicrobium sp.]|nr:cytochrome c family protein [Caldimicrobium sp.]MDW8183536.1 multiheme c-type cytochrome [Caldimicrobium sp.]
MQKWTFGIVLLLIVLLLGQVSSAPVSIEKGKLVDSIDELEQLYPPADVCAGCHGDVYEQWKVSMHSQSILHSIDIIYS